MREGISESGCCNHFRGGDARSFGANPGAEGVPHQVRMSGGQILKNPLSDDASLNESMIGPDFSVDLVSVFCGFPVKVLIALPPLEGLHVFHPEVIGVRAYGTHSLFKGEFDFESQSIQANDFQRLEREVG